MGFKVFNLLLLCVILYLVYGIIAGRNGYIYLKDMRAKVSEQYALNTKLQLQNDYLQQRVEALKTNNLFTYESFARRQLNYIRKDEIFFRIIDSQILPTFYSKGQSNKYIPAANAPVLNPVFNRKN
ncbi:FtsB family cell division protein [Psittacicella gerlachiana]|uniref:Septum formation initiator n=1 Tax=Psittacicella gerlachiana TaxID=2028574 RepID=A0A3A1Y7E3_9GAMM|nr:septum formation initiator family protein [Psittacicella gerlachiana]RIY33179.1 hypothetical protein CKF59_06535 [Psittacicella gerlachiana]